MKPKPSCSSKSYFLPSAILAPFLILVLFSSIALGQSATAKIDQTVTGTNITIGTTAVTVPLNSLQTFTGVDGSVFEVSVNANGVATVSVTSGAPSFETSVGIIGTSTGISFDIATNAATGQTTLSTNTGDVNLATGSGTLTVGEGSSMSGTVDTSGTLTVDSVSGDVNIGGNPVTPGTNVGTPPPPPIPSTPPPSPEQPSSACPIT